MPVSVSCPANEPSFSASAMKGFSRGASSAVIEGKLRALEIAPRQQVVRHLLGHLQRDVLLRFGGGGAEMRRADHVGMAEQRVLVGRLRRRTRRSAAPATWPDFSAARSAASSTSPPRAQLMMRTPFFILAIASASMMFLRLVGQRRVQRDEIGAREQVVQLDLLDAESHARAPATGTDRRR